MMEENLIEAIKSDDIKRFNAINQSNRLAAMRFGRFPVLSIAYLYDAKKIISAYEDKLIKATSWEETDEPVSIFSDFSAKAGKCLRLYLDEIVSPLEMLLILGRNRALTALYPLTKLSAAVKERLKSIYFIKYSLNVNFVGDRIILDKRPLSAGEKKKLATIALSAVLAAAIIAATPVTAIALMPQKGEVTKLSQIDFSTSDEYVLKRDLVLPEGFKAEKLSCKISGNGKKLIVPKGVTLGELSGELTNLTIESAGEPVFTAVTEKGSVKNVTLNVDAAVAVNDNSSFFALVNYGTIENLTANIKGSVSAPSKVEGIEEINFGGIVAINAYRYNAVSQKSIRGEIVDCTVNFDNLSLTGATGANAAFGGVAGANSGYIRDCRTTGKVTADTFDVAGLCAYNEDVISGSENRAELSQVSDQASWSTLACGIVLNNFGEVTECKNSGNLSVVSSADGYVAGIAVRSAGQIIYCHSQGELYAKAKTPCVGGVVSTLAVATYQMYIYMGIVEFCISQNDIKAESTGELSYIGGIAGIVMQFFNGQTYYGGVITNSYFVGEKNYSGNYYGNIAGAVAWDIYEKNSYIAYGKEYLNFENNYYASNSSGAFGTAAKSDGTFVIAEDKGATAASKEDIQKLEAYNEILIKLT